MGTVYKKNVVKYLEVAKELLEKYNPDPYLLEQVNLIEETLRYTIPGKEKTQRELTEFLWDFQPAKY